MRTSIRRLNKEKLDYEFRGLAFKEQTEKKIDIFSLTTFQLIRHIEEVDEVFRFMREELRNESAKALSSNLDKRDRIDGIKRLFEEKVNVFHGNAITLGQVRDYLFSLIDELKAL